MLQIKKPTSLVRTVAVGALLALAVSGCSREMAGSPAGSGYTPPDPATATAEVVEVDRALAVSPDGALLALLDDGRFCVRDRVPTGAKGTLATCADDPGLGKFTLAAFSPNGGRVAAFRSSAANYTGESGWILDTATGSAVPVTLPGDPVVTTTGAGSSTAAPTRASGSSSQPDVLQSLVWQSDDTVIGIGVSASVYRIAASSGIGTLVGAAGQRGKDGVAMAALGGSTVVMSVDRAGGGSRLVSLSLTDGSVRDPVVDLGDIPGSPVLLGVSSDGAKVLLSTADLRLYQPGQTMLYDLASGTRTLIPGTDRSFGVAGGFSPDGTVVAFVATDPVPEGENGVGSVEYALRLAPADGSTAPRSVAAADPSTAYGPLYWSTTGWITGPAYSPQGAAAWTLGS